MDEQLEEPTKAPPQDLIVAFDNEQTVSKTYKIKRKKLVKVSCIMTVVMVEANIDANKTIIQNDEKLKHTNWVKTAREMQNLKEQEKQMLFAIYHPFEK